MNIFNISTNYIKLYNILADYNNINMLECDSRILEDSIGNLNE